MDHYFHPRDEQGRLAEMPGQPRELTDEEADEMALAMAASFGAPGSVEKVRETIRLREEAKASG